MQLISKIIRSGRRSVALVIAPDATLVVRAPLAAPLAYIEDIVRRKSGWVRKKIAELKSRPQPTPKQFITGEKFLYLGQAYKLYVVDNQNAPLFFSQAFFLSSSYQSKAKRIFLKWYWEQARGKLQERADFYAGQTGLKYRRLRINNAQTRWGSCSRAGNLNFSWRLIMAPLPVLDYLVTHEICHLAHPNHSQRFWNKVAGLCPEYQQHRKWLKQNDHLITI
ncbi:MAG: M48 family metallopeptidase [Planctomycetes bacterium]|nr:M48 family metallopeptidase [Planctomycetota bacterium]